MLVPKEFVVNSYSGYTGRDLLSMFTSKSNINYLGNSLIKLVTNSTHVYKILRADSPIHEDRKYSDEEDRNIQARAIKLSKQFSDSRELLLSQITDMVFEYKLPAPEDFRVSNPIHQLHLVNKKFLLTKAKLIIDVPELLIKDYTHIDPDSGLNTKNIFGEYTPTAYYDGVWRPEELFMKNAINSMPDSGYWQSHSDVGFKPIVRNRWEKSGLSIGPFPFWQVTPVYRHTDFELDGLREGGNSDRRVVPVFRYDTSKLRARPHRM